MKKGINIESNSYGGIIIGLIGLLIGLAILFAIGLGLFLLIRWMIIQI